MASGPLTSDIQIDAAGDLKLLVQHGEDWVAFQVSSKAMSLASPVWRAMLDPNGPFKESQSGHNEITLPDDDSKALLILLLAAHLRFQDVPEELSFEHLLEVCVLCDKYDCITLVRPWISRWQARHIPLARIRRHEEWLFIAWTTGDEATFERIGQRLTFCATTRKSSSLDFDRLSTLRMPPGFVGWFHFSLRLSTCLTDYPTECMLEVRLQIITKLIELAHSLVERKEPYGDLLYCKEPSNAENSIACDDLSVGALVRQLGADSYPTKLWPGSPVEIASLYSSTILKLACYIKRMKCNTYPGGGHETCGFVTQLKRGVCKIVAGMPSGMNDSHRRHMATQRSKLDQSYSLLDQLDIPRLPPLSPEKKDREVLEKLWS